MHIRTILAYSARKKNTNTTEECSVIKPDTSSDSPSAKSNGVRFVSARFVINHRIAMGVIKYKSHEYMFIFMYDMFIVWCRIKHLKRIKDIDTSYEIV